jgi:hypothetical protein
MNPIHIEVLHTDACPHWRALCSRVDELARREGIAVVVAETSVGTLDQAEARRFRGSPTLLIEGRDAEPSPEASLG